jgi:hypothetical protein
VVINGESGRKEGREEGWGRAEDEGQSIILRTRMLPLHQNSTHSGAVRFSLCPYIHTTCANEREYY